MPEESQQSTIRKEIRELINEYLEITDRNLAMKENIAELVYFLLGEHFYMSALIQYPYCASKALAAFASQSELRDALLKFMGEDEFEWLCEMLYKMVEFCTSIQSEVNMIKLEKIDWQSGITNSRLSTEELKINKMIMELKVKLVKEKAGKK